MKFPTRFGAATASSSRKTTTTMMMTTPALPDLHRSWYALRPANISFVVSGLPDLKEQ